MRAWLLDDFGLNNLRLGEVPIPTPKDDEVLIEVGAVSLNFRDKAIVDGIYEPHLVPKPLIPVASAFGAKVIVTSSKDENIAKMKALGVWEGINYSKRPDWDKVALELTDGKGVDQLLDVVGGDGLNQSVEATRVGGHISQIGFLQGQKSNLDLMRIIFRQTAIRGIAVAPSRAFERMNDFLNKHEIHPVIDKVYAFEEARQAYEHLARGAFGKIVIKVGT